MDLQLPFGHRSVEVLRCVGGTGAVKNSLSILAFLPLLLLDRFISLLVVPVTGFVMFAFPFLPSKLYSGLPHPTCTLPLLSSSVPFSPAMSWTFGGAAMVLCVLSFPACCFLPL